MPKIRLQEMDAAILDCKPLAPWQDERTEAARAAADEDAAVESQARDFASEWAEREIELAVLALQRGETIECPEHKTLLTSMGMFYMSEPHCPLCRWMYEQWARIQKEKNREMYLSRGSLLPDYLLYDYEREYRQQKKKEEEDARMAADLSQWRQEENS